MSTKHLNRYVAEFSGRQYSRNEDTINQMCRLATNMSGKRLPYSKLTVTV